MEWSDHDNDIPAELIEQHMFVQSVSAGMKRSLAFAVETLGWASLPDRSSDVGTEENRRIVVGLSGGIDSTALLVALHAVAVPLSLQLRACHVNHAVRGAESDDDERFCEHLCDRMSVELHCRRLADTATSCSEASLRESRYQCLNEVADETGSPYLITAHTGDDQVETMLFRLFRGTSLRGLSAIAPARQLAANRLLLRPMLEIWRRDCLEFLAACKIAARYDSSNDNLSYARNFLRHEVIPLIETRFPSMKEKLLQFRDVADSEDKLLDEQTNSLWQESENDSLGEVWSCKQLLAQPLAIQRRLLRRALETRDLEVSCERIDKLLQMVMDGSITRISLDENWDASITTDGNLKWLWKTAPKAPAPEAVPMRVPGITILIGLSFALKVDAYTPAPGAAPKFPQPWEAQALVDLSRIDVRSLVLRQRSHGDVIQPFGMTELVRLKQYLHTHKPNPALMQPVPAFMLLADGNEVLWVPGVGLSEKLRVSNAPTHRLSWLQLAQDGGIQLA